MDDGLTERVEALERAVTDGDHDLSTLAEAADVTERVSSLESRVEELESQVADVDAATQALRGYVGNVRSVNERVETRADTALAKVESLETALPDDGAVSTQTDQRATQTDPTGQRAVKHPETTRDQQAETHRQSPESQQTTPTDHQTTGDDSSGSASGSTGGVDSDQIGPGGGDATNRCHACGRTHSTGETDPGTRKRERHVTDGTGDPDPEDPLAGLDERPFETDQADQTGRLQRFRELL